MNSKILISPDKLLRDLEIKKILSGYNLTLDHPDTLFLEKEKLGVEAVKKIRDHFSLKPYSAPLRAVVVFEADNLTPEAQNALLKTLEEPPEYSLLIMGASAEANLIETVRSRCEIINLKFKVQSPKPENYEKDIELLLTQKLEERFGFVEKLEDKSEFINQLIVFFRNKLPEYSGFVKKLILAKKWLKANVNGKAVLEYLMMEMDNRI